MEGQHPFLIYNASAGSGKTFTLVKAYLKILLISAQQNSFKNILALTFTNKAVAEMKARVVDMLIAFSDAGIVENPTPMFSMLVKELDMAPTVLHQKSKHILNAIAHNYAAFDISTINKFNHRLIRTFAHDLKLPLNFKVELDTKTILASGGLILRPDQIAINDQMEAVIIDYKTGSERSQHQNQLEEYQTILKEMGFKVLKKILVYINGDIQIKEI